MWRSFLTPVVMCAAAFILGSFVLSFSSLGGDVGLIIGSAGVADKANSPPISSFFSTKSAYSR